MKDHTPGPWTHNDPAPQEMTIIHAGVGAGDSAGEMIAYVLTETTNPDQRAEDMANARLIAAAPDMLAALIVAEDMLAGYEPSMWADEDQAAYREITAAIAAATAE